MKITFEGDNAEFQSFCQRYLDGVKREESRQKKAKAEAQEKLNQESVGFVGYPFRLSKTLVADLKPMNKIDSIKLVRNVTNMGLKESKDFVEEFKLFTPLNP